MAIIEPFDAHDDRYDQWFEKNNMVIEDLEGTGFTVESVHQTVFGDLDTISTIQPVEEGHGRGGFVVLKAVK